MTKLFFYPILLVLLSISACARIDPAVRKSNAENFAIEAGFSIKTFQTRDFLIWSAHKNRRASTRELIVYIEGDGLAYKTRNRPSTDPTPLNYHTLRLAAKELTQPVVYLARPCQFLKKPKLASCHPKYWLSHRYSEDVIASYMQIFDEIKQDSDVQRFIVVGFSGGGNIAAHLAARRTDITSLITIAANLDLQAWTEHHSLSSMNHSLNPALENIAESVEQLHFVGEKDEIVPRTVVESYLKKQNSSTEAKLIVKQAFDHHCCWIKYWRGVGELFLN